MPDPCSTDRIRIFVRECTVPLFIGICDHEKPQTQPIIIEVEVSAPLTKNLQNSSITEVIDYSKIYNFLTVGLPKLGHINLLENVAERIIAFCFEDPRIETVRVRLDKPEIFKGTTLAGIEMKRHRKTS